MRHSAGSVWCRNYNLGIIDYDNDSNIIIKCLDESYCYEGYPHVPIEFLDLIINNPNYFKDELSMNDLELENSSINFNKLKFDIYNDIYFQIENTNCLIGFKNNILSIQNIINKLENNLKYDNLNKLLTIKYGDKIVIKI